MDRERLYNNSVEITGNIASISDKMQKKNGKDFMYVNVAQNSAYGKPSFYPLYLDGEILEEFEKENFKVGDRIKTVGKLESYQKDSKQTLHIKPFEISNAKLERRKNTVKENQEIEM